MKNKNLLIALVVVGVALGGFVLSKKPVSSPPPGSSSAVGSKVGVIEFSAILPLTGPLAHLGENERIGMTVALDDIKEKGTPHLAFQFEDSQGKGPTTVTVARKQWDVNGKRFFVVATTGPALAALPMFRDATEDKVVISQTMYPDVTKGYPFAFRLFASSRQEAQLLANHAADSGYKRAAILHIQNEWGTESSSIFRSSFEARGGTVGGAETYTFADKDYRPVLGKLVASKPDVVLLYAYPDNFPAILKQLAEIGPVIPVLANADFALPSIVKDVPAEFLAKTVFPAPRYFYDTKNEKIARFNEQVQKKGNTPNFDIATFYDMTMILQEAASKAQDATPAAFRTALTRVFPYDGVTGHMELSGERELKVDLALSRWVNGVIQVVPEKKQN
jgi:branched-chain amino acid transport system substrate-binding protein